MIVAEWLHVMMKAMVESTLFIGYSVGTHNPTINSHLQFGDDTLLIRVKSWVNVRVLGASLVLFETMLGQKVNFHKSMLVCINIDESWFIEATSILPLKIGRISF